MEEDDILYQSIIADPEKVSPDVDISRLRTQTETSPQLLAAVSEFPGLQFDPTQYSAYEDLYDLYSTGLPMIPTPATDTAQIPGAADILVDAGSQDQATGDTVDQPLVESGEFGGQPTFTTTPGTTVDSITGDIIRSDGSYGGNIVDEFLPVSGTFGGNEVLTTTTGTQIDSETGDITAPDGSFAGNIVDEFGTAGNVYADVPPTTVNVPALNLSGTSEELIDQGVIETPQEFYERTYRTSTGESSAPEGIGPELTIDYDSLDQEEKNLIDQQYGTAYGLSPAVEPAPTLRDVPLLGVQAAFAAKDAYDRATAPSLSETIDFDTYADPGIDAEENQLTVGTNLQTTDTLDITEDPIPEIEPYADPDEITEGLTFQTPAEQIYEADVEAGLATESIFDEPALTPAPAPAPAPAPVYYDSGNGDSGGGGGSSSSSTAGDAPGYSGPSPFKEGGFVKKHAKR